VYQSQEKELPYFGQTKCGRAIT